MKITYILLTLLSIFINLLDASPLISYEQTEDQSTDSSIQKSSLDLQADYIVPSYIEESAQGWFSRRRRRRKRRAAKKRRRVKRRRTKTRRRRRRRTKFRIRMPPPAALDRKVLRPFRGMGEFAKHAKSWLSTTWAWRAGFCNDGSIRTFCMSRFRTNQYWAVRLRNPIIPLKVQVFGRQNCCWKWGNGIEVYAGMSRSWKKNKKCKGPSNLGRYGLYMCPENPTKYVQVVRKKKVKVWGKDQFCQIKQKECNKNNNYARTFRDKKFVPKTPVDCKARASYWHSWCNNPPNAPTGARYMKGARKSRATYWHPPGAGCWITQKSCLKSPSKVGTFRDEFGETHFKAGWDEGACLARAKGVHVQCANSFNDQTTAEYRQTKSKRDFPGPGCFISQSKCNNVPGYVGYFRDTWGEVKYDTGFNEINCLRRAKEFSTQICKNSASFPTTAYYIQTKNKYTYPIPQGQTIDLQEYIDMAKDAAETPISQDSNKHLSITRKAKQGITEDHEYLVNSRTKSGEFKKDAEIKRKFAEDAADTDDTVWQITASAKDSELSREGWKMRRAARSYDAKEDREGRATRLNTYSDTIQAELVKNLESHVEDVSDLQSDHENKLDDIDFKARQKENEERRKHEEDIEKAGRIHRREVQDYERKMEERADKLEDDIRKDAESRRTRLEAVAAERRRQEQAEKERLEQTERKDREMMMMKEFKNRVQSEKTTAGMKKLNDQHAKLDEERLYEISRERRESQWAKDEQLRKAERLHEDQLLSKEREDWQFNIESARHADKTMHEIDAATMMMDADDLTKRLKWDLDASTHHLDYTRIMDDKEKPARDAASAVRKLTECVRCSADDPNRKGKKKCCARLAAQKLYGPEAGAQAVWPYPPTPQREWPFQSKLEPVTPAKEMEEFGWGKHFVNSGSFIKADVPSQSASS